MVGVVVYNFMDDDQLNLSSCSPFMCDNLDLNKLLNVCTVPVFLVRLGVMDIRFVLGTAAAPVSTIICQTLCLTQCAGESGKVLGVDICRRLSVSGDLHYRDIIGRRRTRCK